TTFVLVPRAFYPALYYYKMTKKLYSLGYDAIAINLLSVGKRDTGSATGYDDAGHVRSVIAGLAD
ncbi:hypothetical protein K469DRAFT_553900, partial [Zopfia rhizophila CBS 207.26]